MSECYVKMKNVEMAYPSAIYNAMTLKQQVFSWLKLEKSKELLKDVHALRNFSLEVKSGERVGVIGRNGSGKSTLLRTIAGIYPIESGTIEVKGNIRALFDIGLGFDPESTGRENILYRGLLLGATPDEMRQKTQEIIDFADIGTFIDYPIKTYSSGMLVRLAFSVSTAVSGQVLLLDEVMGAGDAVFNQKAQKRVFDVMNQSELLVFVSHDMGAIKQVCNRVILMKEGSIVSDGDPESLIEQYISGQY